VQARRDDGQTPLFLAVLNDQLEAATLLLEHEAYGNACDGEGLTCLCHASESGAEDIVELLLKHGVDTEEAGPERKTPLLRAYANGHTRTMDILLEHRANPNAPLG
jgi:ankyrin repeat protein